MKLAIVALLGTLSVSTWESSEFSLSIKNKLVRVDDEQRGVTCYVAIEGAFSHDVRGLSCVKVKP